MNKVKNYALLISLFAVIVLGFLLDSSVKEKKRFKANQNSLLSEVKFYKSKDSLNVASVEKLTLKNSELKKFNADLVNTIESLNIKVRRLQSVSQTATDTDYKVKIQVKDSLIYLPGRVDTLKCVEFSDKWLWVSGCVKNKQFSGLIESKDTIQQFVHRVPRKFLFFKYGTKAIRQEVVCKNPHTQITFTEYIELKK